MSSPRPVARRGSPGWRYARLGRGEPDAPIASAADRVRRAGPRAEPAPLYGRRRKRRLELGDLSVPLVDALASPDLRERHESLAELLALVRIGGHRFGRQGDAHLVQDDLDVLCELVPLLADDRHLARLGDEQLPEFLQLGSRRISSGEDAEVDADL